VLEVYLDLSVQGSLPRAAGLNEGLAQVMLVVTGSRRGRTRRLCWPRVWDGHQHGIRPGHVSGAGKAMPCQLLAFGCHKQRC